MATTHSNLWRGYSEYEAHRATLAINTVDTVEFSEVAGVIVITNYDGANDLFVTLSSDPDPANLTNPTQDGSGDTNNEMIRVQAGDFELAHATKVVKLISAAASAYQVVGLM